MTVMTKKVAAAVVATMMMCDDDDYNDSDRDDPYFTWPMIMTSVLLKVINKVHKSVNDMFNFQYAQF